MDEPLARKLSTYKPSAAAIDLIKDTSILLLVGPTGAGKDALKKKLIETGRYHHIISHTTRPPRINQGVREQDGVEYHFITTEQAEKMLDEQAFIESKTYSGNIYGTSIAEIQAAHDENKIAVTDLEVQGVAEYKAFDENVMAVFLVPPDFQTWQTRLQRRYGDVVDAVDHRRRLLTALDEIEQLLNTDFYMPVINEDLDRAFSEVQSITTTHTQEYEQEKQAHDVAEKLAADIKTYLASNS